MVNGVNGPMAPIRILSMIYETTAEDSAALNRPANNNTLIKVGEILIFHHKNLPESPTGFMVANGGLLKRIVPLCIVFWGVQRPVRVESLRFTGPTQRIPAFLHALFPFFSITNNHVYSDTGKSPIENLV
jgi:hypothetical protein